MELVCRIGGDAFKSRLEDAVQFVLKQIRKVGRDLGRNAPYKKTTPPTYVYVVHKFNGTKHALISSTDEMGLQGADESDGSET